MALVPAQGGENELIGEIRGSWPVSRRARGTNVRMQRDGVECIVVGVVEHGDRANGVIIVHPVERMVANRVRPVRDGVAVPGAIFIRL